MAIWKERVFNPGIPELEYGLAEAVYHWVNYVKTCGNEKLIEEHSIRYPLSEYMERKYKAEVSLEQTTILLKSKRYDFYYERPVSKGEITNGYIEVKFLRNDTQYESEQNRFFADLVRLAISQGKENYFILFGERRLFESCFKRVGEFAESEDYAAKRFSGKIIEDLAYGPYTEWFKFHVKDEIDFYVDNYPSNKEFFIRTHKNKNGDNIDIDGLRIRTRLLAAMPTNDQNSSQVVYVWGVNNI